MVRHGGRVLWSSRESEILAMISGNGKSFKYINLYIWSVGLFLKSTKFGMTDPSK